MASTLKRRQRRPSLEGPLHWRARFAKAKRSSAEMPFACFFDHLLDSEPGWHALDTSAEQPWGDDGLLIEKWFAEGERLHLEEISEVREQEALHPARLYPSLKD